MHLASHLGTLGEPHEGRDVGIKPKTVFGSLIPKMEGLANAWTGVVTKKAQAK
jgi:hypothetical protein